MTGSTKTRGSALLAKAGRALNFAKDKIYRRRYDVLAHPVRGARIRASIVPDIQAWPRDVEIAGRLLAAYARAVADAPAAAAHTYDVWSYIRKRQANYFEVLESRDPARLAQYLCNMSRHDATHGTVQGDDEYRKIVKSSGYKRYISLMAKDKLVSLAEAIGATPIENPEQGIWGRSLSQDPDELVTHIEAILKMDIAPPEIDGGLLKLETSHGRFNERDCNALYTAWLLRNFTAEQAAPRLCEIGGGVGRVAYWSNRFGLRDYTIIDLPHINVLQGFYLCKALPDVNVRLYGEASNGAGLSVMPDFTITQIADRNFDLVLNQDSFPEIHGDVVRAYLRWILKAGQKFLSINHESRPSSVGEENQISVPELIAEVGGFDRLMRSQYWLRKGYVVEMYDTRKNMP
jgi:hypothetical protein